MSLGDISAQKLVEKADTIDFKRTLRFTIIGSCIVGPMVRTWFITLEKAFGPVITFRKTVQKVVVDQVGFMPVSQSIILTSLGCLQGLDFAQIKAKWKNEIATVVTTGWKVRQQKIVCICITALLSFPVSFFSFRYFPGFKWSIFIMFHSCWGHW